MGNVHFYRPKTLKLNRKPKFPRKSVNRENKMDQYRVIKHPLTTESAMKKLKIKILLYLWLTSVQTNSKSKMQLTKCIKLKQQKLTLLSDLMDKRKHLLDSLLIMMH